MSKTVAAGQVGAGLKPYMAVVTDTVTGAEGLAPIVFLGNSATGGFTGDPATVSFVNTYFSALHAFTGASIGDLIVEVVEYDVSVSPATVTSTTWLNATTGLALSAPPSAANLTYMGGAGLTDAQLRASAVPVSMVQLAATLGTQAAADSPSVGLSTEDKATLNGIAGSAVAIDANTDAFNFYHHGPTTAADIIKSGAGVMGTCTINHKGSGTSNTTLYDGLNNGGAVICEIDSSTLIGPALFNIKFATGLYIETTGSTAPDVTVTYK